MASCASVRNLATAACSTWSASIDLTSAAFMTVSHWSLVIRHLSRSLSWHPMAVDFPPNDQGPMTNDSPLLQIILDALCFSQQERDVFVGRLDEAAEDLDGFFELLAELFVFLVAP